MRGWTKSLMVALILPALSGCIAKTIVGVATAPVRVAGKAVDLATTSQSEADEKRGREMRRSEERLGRLERDYDRHSRQCAQGDSRACDMADAEYGDMQRSSPEQGSQPE